MNLASLTKLFAKPAEADNSATLLKALASIDVPALEDRVLSLETARKAALLSATDAEIAKLDDEIRAANISADRAVAAREELERRIEAARQREGNEQLERKRADTQALADAAIDAIDTVLRRALSDVRHALAAVAQAEEAVATVNQHLPPERQVVGPEEWRNFGRHGAEEILSRKVVECWAYATSGDRVAEQQVRHIFDQGNGRGLLQHVPHAGGIITSHEVERRRFARVEFLQQRFGESLNDLIVTVKLPPLRAGEPAGWDARARNSTADGGYETIEQLIARTEAEAAKGPVDHRTKQVRWEPLPDDAAVDLERSAA